MSIPARATYAMLIASAPLARGGFASAIWDRAWALASKRFSGRTSVVIHGTLVTLNTGYTYPAFSRRWPTLNDPLVELVHQVAVQKAHPVGLIDIGAAVGDTVLLIRERCPGAVARLDCVEGDPEFFDYLRHNLATLAGVHLHQVMLSDRPGSERSLVRTHLGTASAQGIGQSEATTLDFLAHELGITADVLKVDTDGFDGKVLAGGRQLLSRDRPAVIFEWHPILCRATDNPWRLPFEVLSAAGYDRFMWFTKYGTFSHTDEGYCHSRVRALAEMCLEGRGPDVDWHYDVVALHRSNTCDPAALAALSYARRSRTRRSGTGANLRAALRGPHA